MFKLLKIKALVFTMILFQSICFADVSIKSYFSTHDQCDQVVIEQINKANKTLDIAIYSFTLQNIADAVIVAHRRGVKVRILIDKQQSGNRYAMDEYLESHGITVLRDCRSGYMHNKVIIIDNKVVLTGSYNFSKNATENNAENLLVIESRSMAEEYTKEFNYLWQTWGIDCA